MTDALFRRPRPTTKDEVEDQAAVVSTQSTRGAAAARRASDPRARRRRAGATSRPCSPTATKRSSPGSISTAASRPQPRFCCASWARRSTRGRRRAWRRTTSRRCRSAYRASGIPSPSTASPARRAPTTARRSPWRCWWQARSWARRRAGRRRKPSRTRRARRSIISRAGARAPPRLSLDDSVDRRGGRVRAHRRGQVRPARARVLAGPRRSVLGPLYPPAISRAEQRLRDFLVGRRRSATLRRQRGRAAAHAAHAVCHRPRGSRWVALMDAALEAPLPGDVTACCARSSTDGDVPDQQARLSVAGPKRMAGLASIDLDNAPALLLRRGVDAGVAGRRGRLRLGMRASA